MSVLEKIPTVFIVAVLVGIFAVLKRHECSTRLRLWLVSWLLIFTHFVAQLFEPASGQGNPWLLSLDLGSLQASAVIFVISVSTVVEDRLRRVLLLITIGLPSVLYAIFACYDLRTRGLFVACLAAVFVGGTVFLFRVHEKLSLGIASLASLLLAVGIWTIHAAWLGSFDEGLTAFLGVGFALPGVFLCRNYWRRSPGILSIAGGFFCWGAVFPISMWMTRIAPNINVPAELWNTPKLLVALGMVLSIVEDKSESIKGMQRKESLLNRQLERFSAITSQLLGGASVDSLCQEITSTITEVSNFRVAAISLDNADHSLRVAGASGLTPAALAEIKHKALSWKTHSIENYCGKGRRIGQNSFLVPAKAIHELGAVKIGTSYESGGDWNAGDLLLIPLFSSRGDYFGCIGLDDPRDANKVNATELSRIELLAADLAVALEVKSLQSQLIRSEKLAALGQLVAGVAHELNNPLAAVMGYGELLSDEIPFGHLRARLDKLVNEGRRMKKIVDNLLRFARQSAVGRCSVDLAPIVGEVVALREYYIRTRGLTIEVDIDPRLPPVLVDEDQLKQVLLNLINNAIDAVESSRDTKRIVIRATQRENQAMIDVQDSGPGFRDASRALDPFYTTKPVGKGTGLGLSICYGIVKEHGGDIRIKNVEPHGACVTVELPLAPVPSFGAHHAELQKAEIATLSLE
jgi:two-component system, NtrC family, sensor kinase